MQTTAPRVFLREKSPASERIFSGSGLTKVYVNGECEVRALDGVDIELYDGELVVLLGASGSGKSTLLNTLGGLDVPTSGALTYRGRDLMTAGEDELTTFRRNEVGFVFQSYNLIPSLTARENVALTTEIAQDPMTPEEALELVELNERMDFFPSQLSGGQQQRVAIARAIAKRPRVLFCDEPTGALDVRTGVTVLEAIERVSRELGALVVIITHNAVLGEMADRVMHFASGRISAVKRNRRRCPVSLLEW
jgi:putative ABC transport system ATP-binding protein